MVPNHKWKYQLFREGFQNVELHENVPGFHDSHFLITWSNAMYSTFTLITVEIMSNVKQTFSWFLASMRNGDK